MAALINLSEKYGNKSNGNTLDASEWNLLISDLDTNIALASTTGSGGNIPSSGSGGSGGSLPSNIADNFEMSSKGNFTVKSAKNINLEPAYSEAGSPTGTYGDIALKPGDDIQFCSHHRPLDKQDEVLLKVIDGNDKPVKFLVNASELTFTTKGKVDSEKAEILDMNITTGNTSGNKRGYLKVRARAIDLRCEEHGGVALLPKGHDSEGHMNKIKFEHGGGDGLEFGTFNTEHTSLFTDDYRFNKYGLWKMSTRKTIESDKKDVSDTTTYWKYLKQADDTYDIIAEDDEICDTNSIIKTANAFNYGKNRHAKYTKGGNIEIQTNVCYKFELTTDENTNDLDLGNDIGFDNVDIKTEYTKEEFEALLSQIDEENRQYFTENAVFTYQGENYKLIAIESPGIKIKSDKDVSISTKEDVSLESKNDDVSVKACDAIKLAAPELRYTASNYVSFSTTPKIIFLNLKFKASARFESITEATKFVCGALNNTAKDVYVTSSGIWKYRIDTPLYTDINHTTLYTPTATKTRVYLSDGTDPTQDHYYILVGTELYHVEINSSKQAKANPVLVANLIDGTFVVTEDLVANYTGMLFVNIDYTPLEGEQTILAGDIASGTAECKVEDIITFVNWAKANNFGPWAV